MINEKDRKSQTKKLIINAFKTNVPGKGYQKLLLIMRDSKGRGNEVDEILLDKEIILNELSAFLAFSQNLIFDIPRPGVRTQALLNWRADHLDLILDLEHGHYFDK